MMNKRLLRIIATISLVVLCACQSVCAADSSETTDEAGNKFAAGNSITVEKNVDNELFLAGETASLGNISVGNNVFAAGKDVILNGTSVGSSIFAAGYTVKIDAEAGGNIWTAGGEITIEKGSTAKSVTAAAQTVTFNGKAISANLAAEKVYINGEVTKNLQVTAKDVEFGPDARVTGAIKIEAENEPLVSGGAEVSEIDYTVSEADESDTKTSPASKAMDIALSVVGIILLAFIFTVFAGSGIKGSGTMIKGRPVAMLLSGFLGNIVICILIIGLMFTGFGVRTALLGAAAYTAIFIAGTAFASASLGRLACDKIKPGFNPVLGSVIGAAVMGIIVNLPFIGWLISIFCQIFTLGYIIQLGYAEAKRLGKSKEINELTEF